MLRQMRITRRALFSTAAVVLIVFTPAVEGALRPALFWPLYACAVAVVSCAFIFNSERARKVTLVIVSVALTATASDLVLRLTPVVPDDLVEKWPRMPLVNRYVPGLNYEGHRFNDLSRMAGVKEWREEKLVRVITDSEGFRNEQPDLTRPLDVIILGDSFGGGAVSQEHTWGSLLAREYRLNTYNLSSPASGPWQQYVNLWAEQERLPTGRGTVLVWQLFTGNDLEDDYGSLDVGALPWRGPLGAWLSRVHSWGARSPVRYLIENSAGGRGPRGAVIARDFLNGRKLLFYQPYTETSFRTPEQIVSHPNFGRLRATVGAVKRLAEARGMRLVVVLVPSKEEVYSWVWKGEPVWATEANPSGFSTVLTRLCAEEGIGFLDLKPRLIAESRRTFEGAGQLLYWYDDTHLSTAGYVFTASVIYRELIRTSERADAPFDFGH
jgi:hypothetical protein